MATTRPTNDTGAFAAQPPRVNIFAKPDDTARGPRPHSRGLFDADAAAGRGAERAPDAELVAAPSRPRGTRFGAMLVVLTAVALLAIAATTTALRPSTDHAGERSAPALRPQPPAAMDARERAVSPARPRLDAARGRPRTRKRSKPHRPTRPRRTQRREPSIARARSRPPAVRPLAQPAARPVPQRRDPARAHPAPVPATAPPEFL